MTPEATVETTTPATAGATAEPTDSDIPFDAEVDREALPADFWGSPTSHDGAPEGAPAGMPNRGPGAVSDVASDSPPDGVRLAARTSEPVHASDPADGSAETKRRKRSPAARANDAGRKGSQRATGAVPGADALALPDDADEGLRETLAALQSLFPGRLLSVEQPNDGAPDGEPADASVEAGADAVPTDPDAADREHDDADGRDTVLPRRAGRPGDAEA